MIVEAVCVNGRKPIAPAVIIPGRAYMEIWVHDSLEDADF